MTWQTSDKRFTHMETGAACSHQDDLGDLLEDANTPTDFPPVLTNHGVHSGAALPSPPTPPGPSPVAPKTIWCPPDAAGSHAGGSPGENPVGTTPAPSVVELPPRAALAECAVHDYSKEFILLEPEGPVLHVAVLPPVPPKPSDYTFTYSTGSNAITRHRLAN